MVCVFLNFLTFIIYDSIKGAIVCKAGDTKNTFNAPTDIDNALKRRWRSGNMVLDFDAYLTDA